MQPIEGVLWFDPPPVGQDSFSFKQADPLPSQLAQVVIDLVDSFGQRVVVAAPAGPEIGGRRKDGGQDEPRPQAGGLGDDLAQVGLAGGDDFGAGVRGVDGFGQIVDAQLQHDDRRGEDGSLPWKTAQRSGGVIAREAPIGKTDAGQGWVGPIRRPRVSVEKEGG